MLKPLLLAAALIAVPLTSHALEVPCNHNPLASSLPRFVAATQGTRCVTVTGNYEGSRNALGLPQTRRYLRITPEDSPASVRPLLLLLHARDTNIEPMANLTRVGRLVRDHGITVILPEAINGRFNDDPLTPPSPPLQQPLMDDVAFINALIDEAITDHAADPAQVFIAGYSNGGFMAQRMICEHPERFAGLGSVASSLRFGLEANCPAAPKAMTKVFMHGTEDEVVLYQGLPYRDDIVVNGQTTNNALIAYRSAPSTAQFWASRNGCAGPLNATPIPGRLPTDGDGTTVDYLRYNCSAGIPPVIAYRINGGGHTWPGSLGFAGGTSAVLGPITTQLDATTALWAHFSSRNAGSQITPDQLREPGSGGGGGLGLGTLGLGLAGLIAAGLTRRRTLKAA